jgi:hypothetical protein
MKDTPNTIKICSYNVHDFSNEVRKDSVSPIGETFKLFDVIGLQYTENRT